MLDVLLDDSRTYQDVVKDVFIEKLDTVFTKFKDNGDTHLLAFKGVCNSTTCSNKGCFGYSFIGNNSKQHIDLIFDELSDDIKDIYQCRTLDRNDTSIEQKNELSFDIKFDEVAGFEPSVDFLIASQKCRLAYEELLEYQNTIITKEIYLPWLEKYHDLHKSFDLPPLFYRYEDEFYWLYNRINELAEFLQTNDLAKEALETFQTTVNTDEIHLLRWLTKFEKTGHNLTLFLFEELDLKRPEECDYVIVNDLKIDTSDFLFIAKFKCLFEDHYWDMLEKYTTISNDDRRAEYVNENGSTNDYVYSLTYHLDKGGILLS